MIKLAFIFSTLFAVSPTTETNENLDNNMSECEYLTLEENTLRASLFTDNFDGDSTDVDWNAIELIELEEEVEICFDTKDYLPAGFNPLKGMDDLDWSKIELIELEEEVAIGFDTKKYLPASFNPYTGMCNS